MNKLEEILRVKRVEIEQLRPCAETFRKAVLKRIDFRNFQSAILFRAERLVVIAGAQKASPSAGAIAPSFTPKLRALLCHANFGTSIFRPGRFVVTGISRHFESEANGLDSIPVYAFSD